MAATLVIERLIESIRAAAVYNREVQVAPACILWPDGDRQWQAVIPRLQQAMPELLVLGDYAPAQRSGPAIWLRCLLGAQVADLAPLPADRTPVLYLPGVSRQELRAVESCPDLLKPLAELQYRGVLWSQINAKDWTLLAFLKSDQGGLGLDVAQDNDSKSAMLLALDALLDEDLTLLRGKRLDGDYFNTLITGDPVRDLLQWLDQGDAFRHVRGPNEWRAFVEVTRSQLAFNPESQGVLNGVALLAARQGAWQAVWERYCEAPRRYPNLPQKIRQCTPPQFDLFVTAESAASWPQWNDDQEQSLRLDLARLDHTPPHVARQMLLDLEAQHAPRRQLVWAELGEAPLAQVLAALSTLAQVTAQSLAAGSVEDMAAAYTHHGWQADRALLEALATVNAPADVAAVHAAVRSVYVAWAEEAARHLQRVWLRQGQDRTAQTVTAGDLCLLFVDGLRFDCARRLAALLAEEACQLSEASHWAALPSVTATGKPAVAPIDAANRVSEAPDPYNFEPITAYQLHRALEDNGWKVVRARDPIPAPIRGAGGAVVNRLWCEFGDIDSEGHERGWKLAKQMDALLAEIRDHVLALLAAGWPQVRVVTDHGWLLLPGGLPKIELPSALAENKWGRCAAIKPGAATDEQLYPWYWNPNQHFALANGISCYRQGQEYTHGGLSLQECLTLALTVSRGNVAAAAGQFTDIVWRGLRCTVAVEGAAPGQMVDIRTQPGNAQSSVVLSAKALNEAGVASLMVEEGDLEGAPATLVLLSDGGELVAQQSITIGGA